MSEPLVELRDVFRVHRTGQGDAAALQGVELDVLQGEVLCLLGPSGAGKSTLLRVIAGIDTPSAGTVRVQGIDIGRQPEGARARLRHRYMGLLAQSSEGTLPSQLTVLEALALPLALRGHSRAERRRRVHELLEELRLVERSRAQLPELSGGERQRVALGAAVAHRPVLLLADEPTGELDHATAEEVRQVIVQLARSTGMSVLIASHDAAMVRAADRAVIIAGGRIAEEQRAGQATLVINRGGWLRIPRRQRELSALGHRARSRVEEARLVIESSPGGKALGRDGGAVARTRRAGSDAPWGAAQVQVHALARGYGEGAQRRMVLREMSHRFGAQHLTVVAGRSGSGKTTLLRLLAGLDQPDMGDVLIDAQSLRGRDGEALAQLRRQRIGYMAQEPATVDFLSAHENVVLGLRVRGVEPGMAGERASALLEALGLAERAGQRVHRLSAGEVQRVALARAMAAARGLLILDEPTSRLDETSAELVADLIAQAAREGQTVICASHDPRLCEQADELLELPDGG